MKRTEVCLVSTWSERFEIRGQLSLIHVSDTLQVVEYKDTERSIAVDVDLVELRNADTTVRFTFPRGSNDQLVFKVDDSVEFSVLCRAKEDCQSICDLKLRLNSMLRDSYYSGVYSNLDPDAKLILCEEVERMKRDNPGIFFSSLLNSKEVRDDTVVLSNKEGRAGAISVPLNEVCCIFCGLSRNTDKDMEYLVHPNVPKNSQGRFLFMCSVCLENWKEFRETAEHEGQLILPGEVNEEVCAICSDTPSTLILCGQCARSYCDGCLERVITEAEFIELKSLDADWLCMCCTSGFCQNPPLGRSAWKMVVPCPGRRGQTYGHLVPYTQHGHTLSAMSGEAAQNSMETGKIRSALANGVPIDTVMAQHVQGHSSNKRLSIENVEDQSERSNSPRSATVAARKITKQSGRSSSTGSGGGNSSGVARNKRIASYTIEEVDAVAAFQSQNKLASSSNNRGKRMQKRHEGKDAIPGQPVLDEKYYFGQYVGYYSLLCEEISQWKALTFSSKSTAAGSGNNNKKKRTLHDVVPTDDVCFLCKDGGDLIECDWRCSSAKHGERCLKVYHEYCLDYTVADENWSCPRHYCDMCGGKSLKYICKYCPISLCANCPEDFVQKYGSARYCVVDDPLTGSWCHTPTASGMKTIVCQTCTEMLEAIDRTASAAEAAQTTPTSAATANSAKVKGSAPLALVRNELSVQKKFPGVFAGSSTGLTSSIYLKDVPVGSSSDELTVTSEPFIFKKDSVKNNSNINSKHTKPVAIEKSAATHASTISAASTATSVKSGGRFPKSLKNVKTVEPPPLPLKLKSLTQLASGIFNKNNNNNNNNNNNEKNDKGSNGGSNKATASTASNPLTARTEEITITTTLETEDTKQSKEEGGIHADERAGRNEDAPPPSSGITQSTEEPAVPTRELTKESLASVVSNEKSDSLAAGSISTINKGKKSSIRSQAVSHSSPAASPRSSASVAGATAATVDGGGSAVAKVKRGGTTASAVTKPKSSSAASDQNASHSVDPISILPKKRAASSFASFQIASQLKGESSSRGMASSIASTTSTNGTKNTAAKSAASTVALPSRKNEKADMKKVTRTASSSSNNQQGNSTGGNTKTVPTSSSSAALSRGCDSSDDEGEIIQIAKRQTRSREQEKLSTRSGKKLLSGLDLLPGLD